VSGDEVPSVHVEGPPTAVAITLIDGDDDLTEETR
jgi:hypothetical protein